MKKRFKQGVVLLGAGILTLSMTACSEIQNHAMKIADKIENLMEFPSQYSITYEVQKPENESVMLVTKACDSEGNIYYSAGEDTLLFLKDGEKFRLYEEDEKGGFTEVSENTRYTTAYVDTVTAEFTTLAEQSQMQFTPGFQEAGESTVSGRSCKVFENKVGLKGMNVVYLLQIDNDTGICLSYQEKSETGIFESKPSSTIFTCIEFQEENINFPVLPEDLPD